VSFEFQAHLLYLEYFFVLCYIARIDDKDPGFEHDDWMKRKKPSENEEPLRADRRAVIGGTTRIWMTRETSLNNLVCNLDLVYLVYLLQTD
jgi:hypothetical protein